PVPGELPGPTDVSRSADLSFENLHWTNTFRNGQYNLQVLGGKALRRPFTLNPGDSLLLELSERDGHPAFRRTVYARSPLAQIGTRAPVPLQKIKVPGEQDWVLRVLQNAPEPFSRERGGKGIQLMTTLEQESEFVEGGTGRLEQIRPALAWFEVKTPSGERPR